MQKVWWQHALVLKGIACFALLSLLFLPLNQTHSQVNIEVPYGPESVDIESTPPTPGTNEQITVRVQSFMIDLDSVNIIWFVNGIVTASGIGHKSIVTKTGDANTTTAVEAMVQLQSGETIRKILRFSPGDIDILWEALDSYVPPFYKGKRLPSREGIVKIIAFPNIQDEFGERISPQTLTYDWKWDGRIQLPVSGYGKQFIKLKNQITQDIEEVEVLARATTTDNEAQRILEIPFGYPKIVLYDATTLVHRAVNTNPLELAPQSRLIAEPYYFSKNLSDIGNLVFDWKINNKPVPVQDRNSMNIIRISGQRGTLAKLDVGVSNTTNPLFQAARETVNLVFPR